MNLRRNPEFINRFGSNLQVVRKSKNMSQEELADLAEIPRSTVSRIERGVANPKIDTLKTIADILEIDIMQLFAFE